MALLLKDVAYIRELVNLGKKVLWDLPQVILISLIVAKTLTLLKWM